MKGLKRQTKDALNNGLYVATVEERRAALETVKRIKHAAISGRIHLSRSEMAQILNLEKFIKNNQ